MMEPRIEHRFSKSGPAVGLAMVLALVVSGCTAQSDDTAMPPPPPPQVDVAVVLAEPVTLWESFIGRVEAAETAALRPRVSGYIEEVAFEEGELVEAGDLLFQIDPRPYQARAQAARAELALARSRLQLADSEARRARSLLESRAISQEEHDQRQAAQLGARAQLDAALAALESAELDLAYTRVTAPFSGRTGRALVTRGNLANADQTLLTTLVSVDPVHVYFDADELTAFSSHQVLAGEQDPVVRVFLGAEGGALQGRLDFVDNQLNTSTGTLQYRAVLSNPEGLVTPGQFARVEMPIARLDQALMVDRKAILTDQDRRFVYVLDKQNRTERRQVVTGAQVNDALVIREGLASGDRVIVNGVQRVFGAGMEVIPHMVVGSRGGQERPPALAMGQP